MAQAAKALRISGIHNPARSDHPWKGPRLRNLLAGAIERDRQRRQLAGYGEKQELGRSSGIRG